jgi:hypothetical protein
MKAAPSSSPLEPREAGAGSGSQPSDLRVDRSAVRAWSLLHCGLGLALATVPALLTRRYGLVAGGRATLGLLLALGAQYGGLLRLLRRAGGGPHTPGVADALTLSRATAAAVLPAILASGILDRTGLAGRLCWGSLLWGETVSDWFDGTLARRPGATPLGATLDMESDSWLTLWAAIAAVAWGDLPPACRRGHRRVQSRTPGGPGRPAWHRWGW